MCEQSKSGVIPPPSEKNQNSDIIAALLGRNGLGWILEIMPSIKSLSLLGPFFYLVIKIFAQAYIKGQFSVYGLDASYIKLNENFFIDIINTLVLLVGVVVTNVILCILWQLKLGEKFLKRCMYFACRIMIYIMEIACFWAIVFRDYHDNTDDIISYIKLIYNSVIHNKLFFAIILIVINLIFVSILISYYILFVLDAFSLNKTRSDENQSQVKNNSNIPIFNSVKEKIFSEKHISYQQVAEDVRKKYLPESVYDKLNIMVAVVITFFAVILLWPTIYDLGRKDEKSKTMSYYVYCDENTKLLEDINLSYDKNAKFDCYRVIFRNDEIVVLSPVADGKLDCSKQIEIPLSKLLIERKNIIEVEYNRETDDKEKSKGDADSEETNGLNSDDSENK